MKLKALWAEGLEKKKSGGKKSLNHIPVFLREALHIVLSTQYWDKASGSLEQPYAAM